jgi:excisionase family DNA binding protein
LAFVVAAHAPNPELITIEEAAEYLRLSRNTVYGLCRRGVLPAIKLGRKWRVRRSDLEALFREGTDRVSARPLPLEDTGSLPGTRFKIVKR